MDLRALGCVVLVAACSTKPVHIASRGQSRGGPPSIRPSERVFAGGIVPPAGRLSNPLPESSQNAAAGAQFFTSMNCDGCHGVGAVGTVGPSLITRRWRYGGTDAEIFQSIYYGRPHGMPAFGGALPAETIWKIITYIKSLPPPADSPTESWVQESGK
jgi:cytochrome c oxidase cbb3-type subunit III